MKRWKCGSRKGARSPAAFLVLANLWEAIADFWKATVPLLKSAALCFACLLVRISTIFQCYPGLSFQNSYRILVGSIIFKNNLLLGGGILYWGTIENWAAPPNPPFYWLHFQRLPASHRYLSVFILSLIIAVLSRVNRMRQLPDRLLITPFTRPSVIVPCEWTHPPARHHHRLLP